MNMVILMFFLSPDSLNENLSYHLTAVQFGQDTNKWITLNKYGLNIPEQNKTSSH